MVLGLDPLSLQEGTLYESLLNNKQNQLDA